MYFANFIFVAFAITAEHALAAPVSSLDTEIARRDDAFSDFASGKGSQVFGNAGVACTVGNKQGECNQFGQCAQFIPPNENSVLNQGKTVAECTAGGVTGTL